MFVNAALHMFLGGWKVTELTAAGHGVTPLLT